MSNEHLILLLNEIILQFSSNTSIKCTSKCPILYFMFPSFSDANSSIRNHLPLLMLNSTPFQKGWKSKCKAITILLVCVVYACVSWYQNIVWKNHSSTSNVRLFHHNCFICCSTKICIFNGFYFWWYWMRAYREDTHSSRRNKQIWWSSVNTDIFELITNVKKCKHVHAMNEWIQ